MSNSVAYSVITLFVAVSFAAPNPAINRIDVPGVHKPHSTILTNSGTTLGSSTTPHITLNPRDPAINRIDAVGVKVSHKSTVSSASLTATTRKPSIALNPRDPAINRVDAVGNGVAGQDALFSAAGGTPVTLAIGDTQQLEAAATAMAAPTAVPMPAISVNPAPDNIAVPAPFFAAPAPNSNAIRFPVPGSQTVIYITLLPNQPIAKLDMGQTIIHAIADLSTSIKQNGANTWLPEDNWSWFEQGWDCLLTAERNLIEAPAGREQRLTYGVLHDAVVGLWGVMYSKERFFGCEFEIEDGRWGVVGSGRMGAWGGVAVP